MRVVALLCDEVDGGIGDVDLDVVGGQHLLHAAELHPHDVGYLALVQRLEHDDIVDTVQELRPHELLQLLHHLVTGLLEDFFIIAAIQQGKVVLDDIGADVGGHDDDGVLEVHRTALVVGQTAVVQDLQQDVEHVGVSLLDFIQQDDGIRLTTHSLGQLAALFIAHISWRRSDESRHRVTLLVLRHVDTHHGVLVVEQELSQSLG